MPNTVQVARALMQYNLAVTYANRTEFDKALAALTEVLDISTQRVNFPASI